MGPLSRHLEPRGRGGFAVLAVQVGVFGFQFLAVQPLGFVHRVADGVLPSFEFFGLPCVHLGNHLGFEGVGLFGQGLNLGLEFPVLAGGGDNVFGGVHGLRLLFVFGGRER